ncbi:MAG: hypothetical protein K2L24_00325 [Opitutales bacterium]|nr:hypothetical protein [Opitutales bacterium]
MHSRWIGKIEALCRAENWDYAQFLCMEFLFQSPNELAVRQYLQETRAHIPSRRFLLHWSFLGKTFLGALWDLGHLRTRHRELLSKLDQLLNVMPRCYFLWRVLAEVASSFALYETAIFAIRAIPEPERNIADKLLMGEALYESNDYAGAVEIANQVLTQAPDHIRARDLLWQASVDQSMTHEFV